MVLTQLTCEVQHLRWGRPEAGLCVALDLGILVLVVRDLHKLGSGTSATMSIAHGLFHRLGDKKLPAKSCDRVSRHQYFNKIFRWFRGVVGSQPPGSAWDTRFVHRVVLTGYDPAFENFLQH